MSKLAIVAAILPESAASATLADLLWPSGVTDPL